jgi:predicted NUDIX family NTP pyrophosphohydrolase
LTKINRRGAGIARFEPMAQAKHSAGLLMFRRRPAEPEVLLVHPGGPFWAKKDDGVWSIPKGLYESGEDAMTAAKREFEEETGLHPAGDFFPLGAFRQPGGKIITAWAFEGDFDLAAFRSNLFTMEWPPKSGRMAQFPEADRAGWFGVAQALRKILNGQAPIVQALLSRVAGD